MHLAKKTAFVLSHSGVRQVQEIIPLRRRLRALHISETDNILASHVSLRDPFDALKTKGQLISLRFGAFETPTKSKCRRSCQPQVALPGSQSRPPVPR